MAQAQSSFGSFENFRVSRLYLWFLPLSARGSLAFCYKCGELDSWLPGAVNLYGVLFPPFDGLVWGMRRGVWSRGVRQLFSQKSGVIGGKEV